MAVLTKKVTKAQKQWLVDYEHATGFEPMHQDELDGTDETFEKVARRNIRWYELHVTDIHLGLGNSLNNVMHPR